MLLVLNSLWIDGCRGKAQCVEGSSQACACLGGGNGAQVCRADGTFGACACALGDGSTTTPVFPTPSASLVDAALASTAVDAGSASRDVLVGRWKGIGQGQESLIVEFGSDGSWKMSGNGFPVLIGRYAWNDSVRIVIVSGKNRPSIWRIKLEQHQHGDSLQTIAEPSQLSTRWARMAESDTKPAGSQETKTSLKCPLDPVDLLGTWVGSITVTTAGGEYNEQDAPRTTVDTRTFKAEDVEKTVPGPDCSLVLSDSSPRTESYRIRGGVLETFETIDRRHGGTSVGKYRRR